MHCLRAVLHGCRVLLGVWELLVRSSGFRVQGLGFRGFGVVQQALEWLLHECKARSNLNRRNSEV